MKAPPAGEEGFLIDLLVQATQADQRNSVLTAPRLTLFNGQRSWISIAKGITYVSGLEPITGNNAAGFEPETNVVFEGFVLDLDAVKADITRIESELSAVRSRMDGYLKELGL